jgi:formate dehydrogenase
MVATVEDGRISKLRPDPDHPLSRGYACPKGIAMAEVQNDPDRVLHPLRRRADGDFERVSWREALDDIGSRLREVIDAHGRGSVGWYMGNPGAFSYSHALWSKGFLDGLGSPHYYTAGSQDVNNRFAASALLYGSPLVVPIPDLGRTRFLLVVGANPLVSHGSVLSAPRIREQLLGIERVVVVDPRRTETARHFEHLPVRPDTDAWLLLSLLNVVFGEGLADGRFLADSAEGAEQLARTAREHPPEATEARTGVPADRLRALARDFATAEGAAAYGRTGSCLGRFGTLVSFLLDALNAVTGNLDRPGGAVFGSPPIALDDVAERIGLGTYGKRRDRFGGFPDVLGNLPASLLPRKIETPSDDGDEPQLRALFVSAGNPSLSVPDGEALERAFGKLDLLVSLDLYVNETGRLADYVLPTTTFYEREDMPVALMPFFPTPFVQVTEAVVDAPGEARQEWEIIEDVARRIGIAPYSVPALRALARAGARMSPRRLLDLLLRTGPRGDLFGARRGGLSWDRLRRHPHGLVLDEHVETGVLRGKVRHPGRRVRLAPPEILGELGRLATVDGDDPRYPLRLIGLRELRSHNSWMHNAPLLMRGGRVHSLRVNPEDAKELGLEDGGEARLESAHGSVTVPVLVTDEMTRGAVALPHGWGHRGGWRLANRHAGVNFNLLASGEPEDLERLAGMAHLNGIPVRLEPVPPSAERAAASEQAAAS